MCSSVPFVILAGESAIDKLANGSRVMNVVQNHNKGTLGCVGLPINLIGQVREIKLQILRTRKRFVK